MTVAVRSFDEVMRERARRTGKLAGPMGWSPIGAAEYAGVSRQAIYKAIQTGRLDAVLMVGEGGGRTVSRFTSKPVHNVLAIVIPDRALEAFCRERQSA
jgi:hypothetical protein